MSRAVGGWGIKESDKRQVWWHKPPIPASREAEAGRFVSLCNAFQPEISCLKKIKLKLKLKTRES